MPVHILDKFWINHRSAAIGTSLYPNPIPILPVTSLWDCNCLDLKNDPSCVCWMLNDESRSVTLSHIHKVAFLQILTSLVTSPYVLWLFLAPSHPFDGNSLPTSIEWLSGVRLLAEQDFHRSHRTMFQPTAPSPPKKRKSV